MKSCKKLSIIIISKNEEKHIGKLLDSILKQQFPVPYEIILADAQSKDATATIAKRYGVRVVPGGLPSAGRNSGARHATGDLLLFMDADTIMPHRFLKDNVTEFLGRNLSVATVFVKVLAVKPSHRDMFRVWNRWVAFTAGFWPHATGHSIFCTAEIHKKISGFNEGIKMAEDINYVVRAGKHGKFGVLKSVPILTVARRFEKDGITKFAVRAVAYTLLRTIVGDERADIFKYDLDHTTKSEQKLLSAYLASMRKVLDKKPLLMGREKLRQLKQIWLRVK